MNIVALFAFAGVAAAAPPLFPANTAGGKNWVLLVAGSNTYGNYRHQSDVCHAYAFLLSPLSLRARRRVADSRAPSSAGTGS